MNNKIIELNRIFLTFWFRLFRFCKSLSSIGKYLGIIGNSR